MAVQEREGERGRRKGTGKREGAREVGGEWMREGEREGEREAGGEWRREGGRGRVEERGIYNNPVWAYTAAIQLTQYSGGDVGNVKRWSLRPLSSTVAEKYMYMYMYTSSLIQVHVRTCTCILYMYILGCLFAD